MYVQALLHHIYMESLGRENWRETHRRALAPLGPAPSLTNAQRHDGKVKGKE